MQKITSILRDALDIALETPKLILNPLHSDLIRKIYNLWQQHFKTHTPAPEKTQTKSEAPVLPRAPSVSIISTGSGDSDDGPTDLLPITPAPRQAQEDRRRWRIVTPEEGNIIPFDGLRTTSETGNPIKVTANWAFLPRDCDTLS